MTKYTIMKKIFLLLPLILAFSCSKNENKLADKITEDNVKVAKELFMHFNNHDWQKMADLYTENPEFKILVSLVLRLILFTDLL